MGEHQNLFLEPKLFLQCTKCSQKFGGQNTQTQIYKKSGSNIYVNYSAPNGRCHCNNSELQICKYSKPRKCKEMLSPDLTNLVLGDNSLVLGDNSPKLDSSGGGDVWTKKSDSPSKNSSVLLTNKFVTLTLYPHPS